jgi:hypothetical protein
MLIWQDAPFCSRQREERNGHQGHENDAVVETAEGGGSPIRVEYRGCAQAAPEGSCERQRIEITPSMERILVDEAARVLNMRSRAGGWQRPCHGEGQDGDARRIRVWPCLEDTVSSENADADQRIKIREVFFVDG